MTDRPLRILHLTAGSDAGGLSGYLLQLSEALVARGHHVTLAGQRGALHPRFEQAGWPWIEIPLNSGPLGFLRSVGTMRRYVADHRFDVIHAHYRRATLLGRRLQRVMPAPLLYTLHLSHVPLGWLRRPFTDFGDHTHAASVDGRQWLLDEHLRPAERITVIPHGIRVEQFPVPSEAERLAARAALGLTPADLVAAYVGRLDYPKNEDWLLDLAEASRTQLPNLKIPFAGDGPHEATMRHAITARGLADRAILLGHRDPLPIYHAADALLLPSLREGFSLVTAEAMSTGLPVLRTLTSGATETIIEGVTGRTVEINREAFIRGAMEFLGDLAGLRKMGRAAAQHVRDHLRFERQIDETLRLYHQLVEGKP